MLLLLLLLLLFLFFQFLFCFFFSQNVTPLIKTTLNSGLSFIKHVDCGKGVSKEAHKVLIKKKNRKKCRFLLLASEMGIMLSGKHGEANGSICN